VGSVVFHETVAAAFSMLMQSQAHGDKHMREHVSIPELSRAGMMHATPTHALTRFDRSSSIFKKLSPKPCSQINGALHLCHEFNSRT